MRYAFLIGLCCGSAVLLAQGSDTVYLEHVTISGQAFQRFSTGGNYDQLTIEPYEIQLEEVLSDVSSVYFKSYGNRQLATISFRGTSSSQTNVLWHGIPANYPTLGQLDFSQWPVWMLESIGVQPGSAGALYGSGSIGGTVLLDSEIHPAKEGNYVSLRTEVGSFGHLFTGLKAGYRHKNWSGKTALFRSYIRNDFPYELNGEEFRQKNASVLDYGFQQQLVYRKGDHKWSFDGVVTQNDREVQPSKYSPDLEDHLETENVRLAFVHTWDTEKGSMTNTFAYLLNDQRYNQTDRTRSHQYSLLSTYWFEWKNWLALRAGWNVNRFTALSENYIRPFEDYQTALFGSAEIQPFGWWKMVVNLRQSFYKDNFPFTPSYGQEITLSKSPKHKVSINQKVSQGFRFPTLNDLHWVPGGNPELKPEESLNVEAGAKWHFQPKTIQSELSVTAFKTWSHNWITWLPQGSFWAPVNFQEVEVTGLESAWKTTYNAGNFRQELRLYYSYTRSLNQSGANTGNQLPYTPLHNAGMSSWSSLNGWQLHFSGEYTGTRYTTLDNNPYQSVDSFLLFDTGFRKAFNINIIHFNVGFQVRNLSDVSYENLLNRAMPGRNFQVQLSIKL